MNIQTLQRKNHPLATSKNQIDTLENLSDEYQLVKFKDKLKAFDLYPLQPKNIEIFQVNIGKMCNQTCKHCHVDAGPDRKEIMTKNTMRACLDFLDNAAISTVDITGGAPEMNPHFTWFVEKLHERKINIMVRSNLTIIRSHQKFHFLPSFFKENNIHIISSLPHFSPKKTDAQRGKGVFDQSIEALTMLNEIGYGKVDSHLQLDLVYNPTGAFLPYDQHFLENDFKNKLKENYNITFNKLYTITNLPISRFLDFLIQTENFEEYMNALIHSFNPSVATEVMCRNTLNVSWDGFLYDCDFNQMLDLKIKGGVHISEVKYSQIQQREIIFNEHCYGCTAGQGSSCGGQLSK